MATIRRLTDSCVHVVADDHATLFDPGFHTYLQGDFDLDTLGDVTRVLITHEHGDHAHPEFVRWLIGRRRDVVVHANEAVADVLDPHGIEVSRDAPPGVSQEDVLHARVASGAQPPNRSFTIDGVFTHPGDSREPTRTAPVLALPLMAPWDSITGAVDFARRLRPEQVVPIHDFYLSESGRAWVRNTASSVLSEDGIEVLDLDWGESASI